jgi:cobalt-zinc-cadmium efflux system protein
MAHDHHGHHHGADTAANLRTALLLNAGFALIELVGGLLTGSLAILSDALHDLGDSISLAVAWFLQRLSVRRRDRRFSYGYRRFSMLGALLNTVILVGGALYVLTEAIPRLEDPVKPDAQGMFGLAILGIAVNGLAAYRLSRDRSLDARAVTLHLMEDVLGWVGVLVVSIVLLFRDLAILDPIVSIVISLWVIYNAVRGLRQAAGLFLQAVPEGIDLEALEERLACIEGVLSVHHTHLWSLDGSRHVFSTHLVVPEEATAAELLQIKCAARELIDDPAIEHTTFELEFLGEACRVRDLD